MGPATWEVGDDATTEAGTWEAANRSPASASAPEAKDAGDEDAVDLDLGLIVRKEPWRVSHLMLAIVAIAVLLWLWITLRMLAVVLTVLALIVMGISAGFVVARLRASRQEALLSLLAIAADRGMPLAPAISAFADQFRGRSQRRILDVVASLNAGLPLSEALNEPRRVLSRDALLMVQVGHETGLLGTAMRLISGSRPARVGTWSAVASRLAYLLAVMLVAESLSGFILYFIVPRFEAIFMDFGVPLPGITIFVIQSAQFLVRYSPLALVIYLAQIGLLFFLPFSFSGRMSYQVPIFDRLFARRHATLVLRALSVVIEANKPIELGLRILAEQYPARWMRRRLSRVSTDVQRGADWIDALWRAGVIRRADAEVLASAASVGNLVWACRELAETADRRQQLRVQVLVQSLFPLAIVVMGLAVAILCLGFFIPLVILIRRLSDI
jgi:protein transport protein HofC